MLKNDKKTEDKDVMRPPFKRYTIDLTRTAADELQRIQTVFGLTHADVFSKALVLMSVYANAIIQNQELHIVDPKNPLTVTVINLQLSVKTVSRQPDNSKGLNYEEER